MLDALFVTPPWRRIRSTVKGHSIRRESRSPLPLSRIAGGGNKDGNKKQEILKLPHHNHLGIKVGWKERSSERKRTKEDLILLLRYRNWMQDI